MKSVIRIFLSVLAGIWGAIIAILLLVMVISLLEKKGFPSKVEILADASGNRTEKSAETPVVLQITLDGEIGKDKLTGKQIEEILLDSREDHFKKDRVKAILLVINSPGGGVNDSDRIYRVLKEYKARYQLPIFAYIDGLCASGGYYIACAADRIYSSEVSLIGSIGVLSWPPFMNLSELMEKIGVSALTLSAGKGKDTLNPFRPWQPDEQRQYQTLISFYYDQFVEIVSKSRSIEKETLVREGAQIYPAPLAMQLKLVDQVGASRAQVLTHLVKSAQIEGDYQVVGFETTSWWKKMWKEAPVSPLLTGRIKHELVLPFHSEEPFAYLFVTH